MHYAIQTQSRAPLTDTVDLAILAALSAARDGLTTPQIAAKLSSAGDRISQPKLSRRLTRLVATGHVTSERTGRAIRHRLDPYHHWFETPPARRPKVGYQAALLASYEPNRTEWFTASERAQLSQAGGDPHLDGSNYAKAIAQKLLVDLAYASTALEGNTYTYLDTQVLIEFGKAAEGKEAERLRG